MLVTSSLKALAVLQPGQPKPTAGAGALHGKSNCPNKDLGDLGQSRQEQRCVQKAEGEALAEDLKMLFFEATGAPVRVALGCGLSRPLRKMRRLWMRFSMVWRKVS